MKAQGVAGLALLSIAVILFGVSLPVLIFSDNCERLPNGSRGCAIATRGAGSPAPEELLLAIYGIPFAIGGTGLLALYRLEKPKVKEEADV
ncbi:MAG: hypothetical protein MN733_12680 [Nitrososphaera sp.]|nr:hypothetical protein [Nitrososphaera sp.]